MKKVAKSVVVLLLLLAGGYWCLPYYARRALVHRYPVIDDLSLFAHRVVDRPDNCREWPMARRYNAQELLPEESAYLDRLGTVAFLVIRGDSILHEEYRDGWNAGMTSNIFSATKSIVGLLVGIATGEGKIGSLDDPVGMYLPTFREGGRAAITIRHLLTMSSGLDWDEAYSSLFSATTRGYYGRDLTAWVTRLEVVEPPGKRFCYRSGDTQLLALVLAAATGQEVSTYAREKLWQPLQACHDAYWLMDQEDGVEKAFCCFHTTARDLARIARLLVHRGEWHGQQVVPAAYVDEATRPADYLAASPGHDTLDYYGFQTWIMHYRGTTNPYLRGILGQYAIAIPARDAIVVRLGREWETEREREVTVDLYRYMDIALRLLDEE